MQPVSMKRLIGALVLLSACRAAPGAAKPAPADAAPAASASAAPESTARHVQVHFSPKRGCREAIVGVIASAKSTVRVMAYGFTSQEVCDALVDAKKRGVDVQVVLDKSNLSDKHSKMRDAEAAGIQVFVDSKHAIMHNKLVLVDGKTVQTGSYNYTAAAEESNAENCLVLTDKALCTEYEAEWRVHREHSGLAP